MVAQHFPFPNFALPAYSRDVYGLTCQQVNISLGQPGHQRWVAKPGGLTSRVNGYNYVLGHNTLSIFVHFLTKYAHGRRRPEVQNLYIVSIIIVNMLSFWIQKP